eukprot:TRINITY_DN11669_c0_g1_i1.p1 TRINITY_DN11669_c0_g1~~TRINITY_DN11669_c0_g1_i1.p1  ORF type:complete len:367 (+),score=39.54 TRINITY_DN11669_c0_g1_i1:83-1183(+)
MFNRYTKLKRDGVTVSEDAMTASIALSRRRVVHKRRQNRDFAGKATQRVESWMGEQAEDPSSIKTIRARPNVFNHDFRARVDAFELGTSPGGHTVSPSRYVNERDRVSSMEKYMATAVRECREPYDPIKAGESPFRQREIGHEINPPIRFNAVTDVERCADAKRAQFPPWTDTGSDPTRVPQMGFDGIPVGMQTNAVCVRYKAKAPLALQFKLTSRPGDLNPRSSEWQPEPYVDMTEPSGYGMNSKKNNSRIRVPSKEISKDMYLSAVRGRTGDVAVLGQVSSHRKDRKPAGTAVIPDKTYYGGVNHLLAMSGTNKLSEDIRSKQMATTVLVRRRGDKKPGISNGSNTYAWNELFGYKDHVDKIDK